MAHGQHHAVRHLVGVWAHYDVATVVVLFEPLSGGDLGRDSKLCALSAGTLQTLYRPVPYETSRQEHHQGRNEDGLGAPNERRIVTKLRAARMASGIPTSRPKRCGKPVSGMRLPKNRSDAHSSTVKSASAFGLLTRLPSSSVSMRSAPSKPSHATGCVTTVPTSKSSG